MPRLDVSGQRMIVPNALKRAYDGAGIAHVTSIAQVSGEDRKPALVVLDANDLVLVSPLGLQRWSIAAIEGVDGSQIRTRDGAQVGITGWWYTDQSQRFRAELRERIGQPVPAEGPDSVPRPASVPPRPSNDGLAWVVASLCAVDVGAVVVAALGLSGLGDKAGTVVIPAAVAALIAIPLMICSIKLCSSGDSRQSSLGVLGILLGLAGTLVLVAGVILAISLQRCSPDCFG